MTVERVAAGQVPGKRAVRAVKEETAGTRGPSQGRIRLRLLTEAKLEWAALAAEGHQARKEEKGGNGGVGGDTYGTSGYTSTPGTGGTGGTGGSGTPNGQNGDNGQNGNAYDI